MGAWLAYSKKSKEAKCGWSNVSNKKRIWDDGGEVTNV